MIKINLLPVRGTKKKESAVQQLVLAGALVVVLAVIVLSLYGVKHFQAAAAREEINAANSKINELKKKLGSMEEIKGLKEQVRKKLEVLTQLRKNKIGPAQRLATLSDLTPERLWLTNYNESGQDVKISGVAFSEELIAQFMKSLEGSNDFMSVELLVSEQIESAGTKLKKFELSMKLRRAVPATAPAPPKK